MEMRKPGVTHGDEKYAQTPQEVAMAISRREEFKANQLKQARERIIADIEKKEKECGAQTAPMINQEDIDFVASTQVKLSQKDILKMYVGNWSELNLKQRRKVFAHI